MTITEVSPSTWVVEVRSSPSCRTTPTSTTPTGRNLLAAGSHGEGAGGNGSEDRQQRGGHGTKCGHGPSGDFKVFPVGNVQSLAYGEDFRGSHIFLRIFCHLHGVRMFTVVLEKKESETVDDWRIVKIPVSTFCDNNT